VKLQELDERYSREPLHDAHVDTREGFLREQAEAESATLRERQEGIAAAAQNKIAALLSGRYTTPSKFDKGGNRIETTCDIKKSELVKSIVNLYKESVLNGGGAQSWANYETAFRDKATLIKDESERDALLDLVNNEENKALWALARGPFTPADRRQAIRSNMAAGMSEQEANAKADTVEENIQRSSRDAEKILQRMGIDTYNLHL
jgi:hypothetical protein